jgi:hypothetical protein
MVAGVTPARRTGRSSCDDPHRGVATAGCDVVEELNADRGGFTTTEAVLRLIAPNMAGTPDDMTKPQTRIYRLGASTAVVQWSPSKRSNAHSHRVTPQAVLAALQADLAARAHLFGTWPRLARSSRQTG